MSATELSIINLAMAHLGSTSYTSLDMANPLLSNIRLIYSMLKPKAIGGHTWSFATKWATLVKSAESTDNDNYQYAYHVPNDKVRVVEANPIASYEQIGNLVYSNQNTLKWRYIADVSESMFTPSFAWVLSLMLASSSAFPVTQTPNLAAFFEKKAEKEYKLARYEDSQGKMSASFEQLGVSDAFYVV